MTSAILSVQSAVAKATVLGAKFYELGADLDIALPDGIELPTELREALAIDALVGYLGIAEAEAEAIAWCEERLRGKARLRTTAADYEAAIARLDGPGRKGFDIESMVPGRLPLPIAINRNGTVATRQPKDDGAALDHRQAVIASAQICSDGDGADVFIDTALQRLLAGDWLREQHLVCHNAAFELIHLLQAKVELRHPPDDTMHAHKCMYGGPHTLANTWRDVCGDLPPKAHGRSYWGAARLSKGQICYAAADAIMAWVLGEIMLPKLERSRCKLAYELVRDALPATAAMQRRGLGFNLAEHGRQVAGWRAERDKLLAEYRELMKDTKLGGKPPKQGRETIALVEWVLAGGQP